VPLKGDSCGSGRRGEEGGRWRTWLGSRGWQWWQAIYALLAQARRPPPSRGVPARRQPGRRGRERREGCRGGRRARARRRKGTHRPAARGSPTRAPRQRCHCVPTPLPVRPTRTTSTTSPPARRHRCRPTPPWSTRHTPSGPESSTGECDNPPRKISYYRLKPIHFGH
jgi:hypothetical protein